MERPEVSVFRTGKTNSPKFMRFQLLTNSSSHQNRVANTSCSLLWKRILKDIMRLTNRMTASSLDLYGRVTKFVLPVGVYAAEQL